MLLLLLALCLHFYRYLHVYRASYHAGPTNTSCCCWAIDIPTGIYRKYWYNRNEFEYGGYSAIEWWACASFNLNCTYVEGRGVRSVVGKGLCLSIFPYRCVCIYRDASTSRRPIEYWLGFLLCIWGDLVFSFFYHRVLHVDLDKWNSKRKTASPVGRCCVKGWRM